MMQEEKARQEEERVRREEEEKRAFRKSIKFEVCARARSNVKLFPCCYGLHHVPSDACCWLTMRVHAWPAQRKHLTCHIIAACFNCFSQHCCHCAGSPDARLQPEASSACTITQAPHDACQPQAADQQEAEDCEVNTDGQEEAEAARLRWRG